MRNKKILIIAAAVLVLGAGSAAAYLEMRGSDSDKSKTSQTATNNSSAKAASLVDTTSNTYKLYAGLKGDDYDRQFLANMVAHHQGAVDMAKLAQANAKHAELKNLANQIVTAQEKEIANMTAWQKAWGYPSTSANSMQDHSAMGTMDTMAGMMAVLEGKTGDAFDKAFIQQMIMHHQSAINMAGPGKSNALHQEVKDLSAAIVTDQSREIQQLQQWQKDWGYLKDSNNG